MFDHTRPNGMSQKLLDVSKLANLGWQAKTFVLLQPHNAKKMQRIELIGDRIEDLLVDAGSVRELAVLLERNGALQ